MNNEIIQASILTIGDELMIGQVVDTNSAWIARQLNMVGIWVRKRVAVGDNYAEMRGALEEEGRSSSLVIITGGLGPTADDITKPFLCDFFNTTLVLNEEVLQHITHLFKTVHNKPLIERNRKQAEVPASCTVIFNTRGTAPGMLFEKNGVTYISLPGVPFEMKGMMTDLVLPLLKQKFVTGSIVHRTLLTAGIGESYLAEHIASWEAALPPNIKLAYLPNHGMIRLRLTATGEDANKLQSSLTTYFERLKQLVSEWLVSDEDISMPQVISKMLKERKKNIGTAESCTGGYIAHLLTQEAGASELYNGTVVSYSNQVKVDLLHVKNDTLETEGAVSEATVRQMATGALQVLKCDYVISASGIMGPDGGSQSKPVGTVWIAAGNERGIITQRLQLRYDRSRNIELAAIYALNLLRRFMLSSEDRHP